MRKIIKRVRIQQQDAPPLLNTCVAFHIILKLFYFLSIFQNYNIYLSVVANKILFLNNFLVLCIYLFFVFLVKLVELNSGLIFTVYWLTVRKFPRQYFNSDF
jgi:hypothetical protein